MLDFQEIRDTSPLGLKSLNDQLRLLWVKSKDGRVKDLNAEVGEKLNISSNVSITSKVSNGDLESALTIRDNAISLKASQSALNATNTRVTTAEASIVTQAGQITLKVSASGVISAINLSPETITISATNIGLLGAVNIPNLTANKIVGGTLTLGGVNNISGVFTLKNNTGATVGIFNNTGVSLAADGMFKVGYIGVDTGFKASIDDNGLYAESIVNGYLTRTWIRDRIYILSSGEGYFNAVNIWAGLGGAGITTNGPTCWHSNTESVEFDAIITADAGIQSLAGHNLMIRNIGSSQDYANGQLELQCTDGGNVVLGFHRAGYTATALVHAASGGIKVVDSAQAWAPVGASAFNVGSDRRLKENIELFGSSNAYEKVKSLIVHSYNLIEKEDKVNFPLRDWNKPKQNYLGIIADEAPVEILGDLGSEYQTIDLYKYTTLVMSALQEAIKKIEVLESRLGGVA